MGARALRQEEKTSALKGTVRERASACILTPKERAIFDHILAHEKEIIHMSISEVAERCGISEASLVRFSKKLGYKGFQALKISVAQECVEPIRQFHESLSTNDSAEVIAQKIFRSYMQALDDSLRVLEPSALEQAAEVISSAHRVIFVAAGGSENVAQDAVNKLLRIGIAAYAFEDYNMQKMLSSVATERDVVIAISHSGATISTIDSLKQAKENGAVCIAITNSGKSPILKYCDICLFTSSQETFYKSEALSSRIAQLTVIDTLITIIAYRNETLYYRNLQKTRKALDETKL
ncbi:MAG: MurR/RpiR family transcriptional regulator [Lachnospiraceae bacterium]|nr:MurR/RpiR family transcriptional regulator [Lachnospiraceae bacterium]